MLETHNCRHYNSPCLFNSNFKCIRYFKHFFLSMNWTVKVWILTQYKREIKIVFKLKSFFNTFNTNPSSSYLQYLNKLFLRKMSGSEITIVSGKGNNNDEETRPGEAFKPLKMQMTSRLITSGYNFCFFNLQNLPQTRKRFATYLDWDSSFVRAFRWWISSWGWQIHIYCTWCRPI